MTLYRKSLIIVVLTFAALVCIIAAATDVILLDRFTALEKDMNLKNASRVRNEILEIYDELDLHLKEITAVPGFSPEAALKEYVNHSFDMLVVLDADKKVLSSGFADFQKRSIIQKDRRHDDFAARIAEFLTKTNAARIKGVLFLEGFPVFMISRSSGEGPAKRSYVIGRVLDKEELYRISRNTESSIDLINVAEWEELEPDFMTVLRKLEKSSDGLISLSVAKDRLAAYFLINDPAGAQALVVRLVEKKLLLEQGKKTIAYTLTVLISSCAVFCVVIILFMRSAVLRRLVELSHSVRKIAEENRKDVRLAVDGDDELSALSNSINRMLDSMDQADIALRESEERHRILFEKAPDSIFIISAEGEEAGSIVAANHAAAEQHGFTIEELCGMKIFELNTPESNRIAAQLMQRMIDGEWIVQEMWHRRKDGTQFPIDVHAGMVKFGNRNYILGFDRDVTEQKMAEESERMKMEQIRILNDDLARRGAELQLANQELETFNYSVSHDLRGPLTRISGYCQLILEDADKMDGQHSLYVTRIYDATCWLDDMIDTMMELSRLTRAELKVEPVDLSAMAAEILGELASMDRQRDVDTFVQTGIVEKCDAKLVRIMLTNLLGNAWKYSSKRENARISFEALSSEDGRQQAFVVRDNGAGFDMKSADRLFRVFTRLHAPEQFEGSGIGLATVQRIVLRHGGRIWAEAVPGAGASFFFTLSPEQPN